MRSGRTIRLKIAFALCGAVAFPLLRAADPAPAAKPAAPEKIEFSSSSSAKPKIPKPGVKTDELLNRYGNVPDVRAPSGGPDLGSSSGPAVVAPSRQMQDKMAEQMDRKKNWLVPGAQDAESAALRDKDSTLKGADSIEKKATVMERYFSSSDAKKERELRGAGPNARDNRLDRNLKDTDSKTPETPGGEAQRDPNDSRESNGLADFNLKNYIRAQNGQAELLKDNQLPKASQLFRSDFGNPAKTRLMDRERTQTRERDAARTAQFNQLLMPRTAGGIAGVTDPINAPDLSRREMNPILPRVSESGSSQSAFPTPGPSGARFADNNILGVTGPAVSSIAPIVNVPSPRPEPMRVPHSFIGDPPKRGF